MSGSFQNLMVAGLVFAASAVPALAQWNDPIANTPPLIQNDFGPNGDKLPGDGGEYCEPTSLTMNLYWASSNGFTQLAPSSYNPNSLSDQAAALNLDKVIAGLLGTTANGGTTGNGENNLSIYFAAEGLSSDQFHVYKYNPTTDGTLVLSWLGNNMESNTVPGASTLTFQIFDVSRFSTTSTSTSTLIWTKITGHVLDPLEVAYPGEVNQTVTLHNPLPSSFEAVADIPANSLQTIGVTQLPAGITFSGTTNNLTDPSNYYSQVDSSYLAGKNQADVIGGATAWSLDISALPSSSGYIIHDWAVAVGQYINTNGGTFTVIAGLTGTGGFQKAGDGTLLLTNANSLSGTNVISGGTLASKVTNGTPFGTGFITLENNSVLQVQPDDTTPTDVNLQIASGTGANLTVDSGGGILQLTKRNNTSLTVTLGGNVDGATPNIISANAGTLVIASDAGLSEFGNSVKLLVTGATGNLPPVTNGMVSPAIVGQDSHADRSGAFLTYSGTYGFVTATTVGGDINDPSITGTTIFQAATTQSITSSGTVAVYALEVDAATLSGTPIQVGTQVSEDVAGMILNGGTLSTSELQLGAAAGTIYTSLANGTVNSRIDGSGGLTTFGPGQLTITSNNSSSLSGAININSGTLLAANSAGSATGTGPVSINSNAMLQVNSGASVSGSITVGSNATLYLNGGTVTGTINVAAPGTDSAQPGGTLTGHGTITGTATIGGIIKAGAEKDGIIEFQSAANLIGGTEFFWQPTSLADNSTPGSGPGIDWNSLQFDISGLTQLGNSSASLTVYLDFSQLLSQDPDSSNSFWNQAHTWTLIDFQEGTPTNPAWYKDIKVASGDYSDGTFSGMAVGSTYVLEFQPAPEPGTWALLACGLGFIAISQLRRNRSR